MSDRKSLFNLEVFRSGEHYFWLMSTSLSDIFRLISTLESTDKLSELTYTYHIFRESEKGRWFGFGFSWDKVCNINSKGEEKSFYFREQFRPCAVKHI